MDLFVLRAVLLVVVSLIAAITDLRKGLIYDWLTLPAIAIGITISIFSCFQFCNLFYFLIPIAVFLLAYPLYYAGKIGGGDVKLFVAITALLPFKGQSIFIVDALIFASVFALTILGIYYIAKLHKMKKLNLNSAKILKGSLFGIILLCYALFLYSLQAKLILILLVGIASIGVVLTSCFADEIKKEFFVKFVSVDSLEEHDVIAFEFLDKKTKELIKESRIGNLVSKGTIEKLKKGKIKRVAVYRGMPAFAPFIFLGVIAALVFKLY